MPGTPLLTERIVIAAAVVLTAVLFLPSAADPVNVVKLSVLALCTAAALGLAATRVLRTHVLTVPAGPAVVVTATLLLAFVASAGAAPQSTTAVVGAPGRNSGLVAYACVCLILGFTLRYFDRASIRVLAFAIMAAGGFTASYGLFQLAGWDAINWNNPFNPVIASLGNPDFASGYLGIAVPVAAWGALWSGWHTAWRAASAGLALASLLVAVLSDAVLGPIAAVAGLLVLGLGVTLELTGRARSVAATALTTVVGLGVLGLLAGTTGRGPAGPFFSGISYEARTWYWSAAIDMWQRRPLLGVGLDSYGTYWWQERPLAATRQLGPEHYSDSAHGVPLQHLAQGGLLLFVAYLALIGVVAWALVVGMRRLRGQDRLLLAGLGGSWVAYHVQSLVSIDQVPLLTVHFVLAGAVVVASGTSRLREFRLPGALPEMQPPARPRNKGRAAVMTPRQRALTGADLAGLAVVAICTLALVWVSLIPVRASRAVHDGDAALARGNGTEAVAAYERAIDLVPGAGHYRSKRAAALNAGGLSEQALVGFEDTIRVDPFDIGATRTAARLADAKGDLARARRYYVRALELVPDSSSAILDLAIFDLKHSRAQDALLLLEKWAPLLPETAALWASLGDARAVTGDASGAREAYDRAIALQPDEPTAVAGLQKLDASA